MIFCVWPSGMKSLTEAISILGKTGFSKWCHLRVVKWPKFGTRLEFQWRTYCSEVTSESATVKAAPDLLLKKISSSTTIRDVLHLVNEHHSIMNDVHLVRALRSVFELHKSGNADLGKEEVVTMPEFYKLCHGLKNRARFMDVNTTIEALKISIYLGVPTSSRLVQVLLHYIKHNINDLSLDHILFLDFLLNKCERSSLSEALKIALPLVLEANLNLKLDRDSQTHLSQVLLFIADKRLSEDSANIVVSALNLHTACFDVKTAKRVVRSLCSLHCTTVAMQELLQASLNVLASSIEGCSYRELNIILSLLIQRYHAAKEKCFYHEDLMDSAAKYLMQSEWNFSEVLWILKKLTIMGHINIPLLDYIGNMVCNSPSMLTESTPASLFNFVSGFASADYRPAYWDIAFSALMKNKLFQEDRIDLPWIKLGFELAILGSFPESLLQRVFDKKFLEVFLGRKNNFLDYIQLLQLYQAVVTLCPSYQGPFPPEDVIQAALEKNNQLQKEFPLQGALETALGGPSYIQTKIYTKLGHFIDHMIVMRKGGYPVALNQIFEGEQTYVENFSLPVDSQIIMIMVHPPKCYATNCERLKGTFSVNQKMVEALGYPVIAINQSAWLRLPDYEKIPCLMQNLKQKLGAERFESEIL